jgi:hypothetical protein
MLRKRPGTVSVSVIPAAWEKEIEVQGQSGKSGRETPSQTKIWAWWYTSVIPATQET